MKIQIGKNGRSFGITIPFGAVKLLPAGFVKYFIARKMDGSAKAFVKSVDIGGLKKAFYELKQYKDLNIVEVKNARGEEFVIRV